MLIASGVLQMEYRAPSTNSVGVAELRLRGPARQRMALSVQRMDPSGPHEVYMVNVELDINGEVSVPLLERWPDGLYITLLRSGPPRPFSPEEQDINNWQPFEVRDGQPNSVVNASELIALAIAEQSQFREHEIRAEGFTGENRLTLYVIVDGCDLDYPQVFRGGHLHPLQQRVGPESLVAVVNALLPEGSVPFFADVLRDGYSQAHPLCLVTFVNVQAPGVSEAAEASKKPLERILNALSEDRSASPRVLAYLAQDQAGAFSLTFPVENYSGNRIPGFGPGVTGLLDMLDEAVRKDEWIDFALSLMRSIRLQSNMETQIFQAWSLIEAAAKRTIASNESIQVLDDAGRPIRVGQKILTQGRDLGRVIVYLRDHVGHNKLITSTGAAGTGFYGDIQALYNARNRIAHEGGLAAPGAAIPQMPIWQMAFIAKDIASTVVRYEIRRLAGTALP